MLNKFVDLKFYNWYLNFFNSAIVNKGAATVLVKYEKNIFFHLCAAQILERLNMNFYWMHIYVFFLRYPYRDVPLFFAKSKKKLLTSSLIISILIEDVFPFWLLLPDVLCSLKQYYPMLNIPFDNTEFVYLDSWINVLPVVEELLIYLVETFEPLNEPLHTAFYVTPGIVAVDFMKEKITVPDFSERFIMLKQPIKEDHVIRIEDHLKEYYFNNDVTSKDFLEIIELYLEARPELKETCLKAWNKDKALGKKIPEN